MLTVTIPLTTISATMPLTSSLAAAAAALACLALHAACRAAAFRPQLQPVRVRRR